MMPKKWSLVILTENSRRHCVIWDRWSHSPPWSHAAKRQIKELKKISGRKLIKSRAPKRLWDDCLKLESYIRSNTVHVIYKLDGELLETIMSGEMSNIRHFCEFERFEWVIFWDEMAPYPDDHFILDRYLGLSIDIGHTLMTTIIERTIRSCIGSHIKH